MEKHVLMDRLQAALPSLAEQFPEMELVYLFGSQVDGNTGPASDYDFALLLDRTAAVPRVRSRLHSELVRLLQTPRIDVVVLNNVPVEFAFSIISKGELLYERDLETRVDYEARIMGLYFDYLPVLRAAFDDILREDAREARTEWHRKALGRTQRTLDEIRALKG